MYASDDLLSPAGVDLQREGVQCRGDKAGHRRSGGSIILFSVSANHTGDIFYLFTMMEFLILRFNASFIPRLLKTKAGDTA